MKRFLFSSMIVLSLVPGLFSEDLLSRCCSVSTQKEADLLLREISSVKDGERDLLSGIVYHNLAVNLPKGKEANIRKAREFLSGRKNYDVTAKAYYGSLLTVDASVAFAGNNIVSATALINEGFTLLDSSVSAAPDSLLIRLLRIENSLAVSDGSPFKRDDVLKQDIEYLSKIYTAGNPDAEARLLFYRGELACLTEDLDAALTYFEKAVRAAPASAFAARSKKRIFELEE